MRVQSIQVLKVVPGKWCGSSIEIKTIANPVDPNVVPEEECQIIIFTNHTDIIPMPTLPGGKLYTIFYILGRNSTLVMD